MLPSEQGGWRRARKRPVLSRLLTWHAFVVLLLFIAAVLLHFKFQAVRAYSRQASVKSLQQQCALPSRGLFTGSLKPRATVPGGSLTILDF